MASSMITDIKEVMLGEVPIGTMVQLSPRGRWWKVTEISGTTYKLVSTHSYHTKLRASTEKVWIGTDKKMTELQQQVLDHKISQSHYSRQIAFIKSLYEERDRCKEVVRSIDNLLANHYKQWVDEYENTKEKV